MPPGTAPAARRSSVGRTVAVIAVALLAVPALLFGVAVVAVAARGAPAASPGTAAGPSSSVPAAAPTPDGPRRVELIALMKGDCFTIAGDLPESGEKLHLGRVEAVDCAQPHNREVVTTLAYPGITWEGGGEAEATEDCRNAVASDVRDEVVADRRYRTSYIRAQVPDAGGTGRSLYVLCVVASAEATTGSALT
jgi:hypothetical protein